MNYYSEELVLGQELGNDLSNDFESFDALLQDLENEREFEQEILNDLIDDIEDEIEKVGDVYENNASKLKETIRGQKQKLEQAERSAGEDEREIRDRLAKLYRELRRERREELANSMDLKMRKWELKRELEELDNSAEEIL